MSVRKKCKKNLRNIKQNGTLKYSVWFLVTSKSEREVFTDKEERSVHCERVDVLILPCFADCTDFGWASFVSRLFRSVNNTNEKKISSHTMSAVWRFRFNHTKCLLLIIINRNWNKMCISFPYSLCFAWSSITNFSHVCQGVIIFIEVSCYFLFVLMPDKTVCVTCDFHVLPLWVKSNAFVCARHFYLSRKVYGNKLYP